MAPTSYLLFFFFFIVSHLVLLHSAEKEKTYLPSCPPFFCGILGNISFPFSGFSRYDHFSSSRRYDRCGLFSIDCNEPLPKIQLGNQHYEAIRISQSSDHTILVHDPLLAKWLHSHSCSSFENQITLPNHPFVSSTITHNLTLFKCYRNPELNPQTYKYFNGYRNYSECDDFDIYYTLPKDNQSTLPGTVPYQCRVIHLPVSPSNMNQRSGNLFTLLVAQFSIELHVSSDYQKCVSKGGDYYIGDRGYECFTLNNGIPRVLMIKVAIATSASGIGIVVVLVCFFWRRKFNLVSFFRREFNPVVSFFRRKFNLVVSFFRRKSSLVFWKNETKNHKIVEAFLRNCGTLTPKRYSYSNIKKMTNSFKDKLGQGGFGVVYKGKLQDGCLVAVKVLNESKGNGEEFINEAASISRTSHVNIVALLGFCFEGSRSALIYEFMPNGSLEKFIYDENPSKTDRKLGWETLHQIAVGIAQGLEYLHRGCNTQILHFDIKPHNILLDEDFCPKISDFGLAKLCSRKESIVSMLVARGTNGYIAPEVCCRDIGGVSHKSDVYSYGMMVLEMIGGRKNLNVGADHTSEIYFPHWIYKRLELDEELELHGIMNEDEKESARKMIIVGLWCIQTDPSNRPPMSRVVNMLEGSLESLEIPPKPFLSSPSRSPADSSSTTLV